VGTPCVFKLQSLIPCVAGDRILIRRQTDKEGHWYEGRVWDVQQLRVDLRLPGKAAKITAQSLCDVRFKLNRIPLQRQHQALDITKIPKHVTFPTPEHALPPVSTSLITSFVNPEVDNNPQQRQAIKFILSQQAGSPPFVIFGP
jgi:helicase MOV-10